MASADRPELSEGWLVRELNQLPEGDRRDVLGRRLHEQIADILEIGDPHELDPNRPLFEVGLTSVRAVKVRNVLCSGLTAPLPATLLFDHPTIEALTSFLAHEILGIPPSEVRPAVADATSRLMETLEQMTDEEAAALLLGGGSS